MMKERKKSKNRAFLKLQNIAAFCDLIFPFAKIFVEHKGANFVFFYII